MLRTGILKIFIKKEIFILNKMKELCDGLDGVDIRMTQQTLPLLFMTEEWTETKMADIGRTRVKF